MCKHTKGSTFFLEQKALFPENFLFMFIFTCLNMKTKLEKLNVMKEKEN